MTADLFGPDHAYARMDDALYAELVDKQGWDLGRLLEDQNERLARQIESAVRTVPYYRSTFGDVRVRDVSDLVNLPVLTRKSLQENSSRLIAEGVPPASLRRTTTGGTTGQPLVVYRDPAAIQRERAHVFAAWRRFGVLPGQRVAVVVARAVGPDGAINRYVEETQTLWLGGEQFPPERLDEIVDRLQQFRPVLLRGYPTTLTLLGQHMIEQKIEPPDSLVAVGTSSEVLYPWQASVLREAFRRPIANLYGQTEQVALAVGCRESTSLHVDTTYGVVEILDAEGRPISEPGVVGELVATGLVNVQTPLIRYAIGDRAAWDTPDCPCGLQTPRLTMFEGRTVDRVVDRHGQVHLFNLRLYEPLFEPDTPVARVQFWQDEPGVLRTVVRPKPGVTPEAVEEWARNALAGIDDFDYVISARDEFRSTKSGKQPLFFPMTKA